MSWYEQRRYGGRPVVDASWFEARAYARWLTAQLRPSIEKSGLGGNFEVMLPTEGQWERADRAATLTTADERRWPWQGDDSDIDQRANVNRLIGSANVVGLYPPNPVGLLDMAGNLWERMGNLISAGNRIGSDTSHLDRRSLRGGSWIDEPVVASCTCRFRYLPDAWNGQIGFRVVLSLAENES